MDIYFINKNHIYINPKEIQDPSVTKETLKQICKSHRNENFIYITSPANSFQDQMKTQDIATKLKGLMVVHVKAQQMMLVVDGVNTTATVVNECND